MNTLAIGALLTQLVKDVLETTPPSSYEACVDLVIKRWVWPTGLAPLEAF